MAGFRSGWRLRPAAIRLLPALAQPAQATDEIKV
jgi:hypothetical protein